MREYGIDVLDFYRGTLSARRLAVLIRGFTPETSAYLRAVNDGQRPWSAGDHLLADLWILTLKMHNSKTRLTDHPTRAAMQEKARAALKRAKVIKLREVFEKRKRTYGLGVK